MPQAPTLCVLNLTKASASDSSVIGQTCAVRTPTTRRSSLPREICGQGIFPREIMGVSQNWRTKSYFQGRLTVPGAVRMGTIVLARCSKHTNSEFGNFEFSRFLVFASKNRGSTLKFLQFEGKITWFWSYNGGGNIPLQSIA